MDFCPTCANLLLVEGETGELRYFCQTCPYVYTIKMKVRFEYDLLSRPQLAVHFTITAH